MDEAQVTDIKLLAPLIRPSEMVWVLESFELSDGPYRALWEFGKQASSFLYEQEIGRMEKLAKSLGFKRFRTQYKAYLQTEKNSAPAETICNGALTQFENQPMELNCGSWDCSDFGIYRNNLGRETACAHAIMPIERLVNIDTNEVKIKLAYKRSGARYQWQTVIVDKESISTARNIVSLAKFGISVTSGTAPVLVDYLNDVENLNYDIIPERKSICRLGYIPGEGFSPYVDGLIFDGDANYRSLYSAVTEKGRETAWYEAALECRKMSVTARIILAASFASVLVEPLGCLPFFVHLWGIESGTGKTVALMLAASVWGNPAIGEYIKTFDATAVGCEKTAAFLNHLPLCMDELQLTKDGRGKSNFDVYKLAQGVGRTRGNRSGGVDATPTWRNCILTTGESPLVGQSAGAGAVNRVIDIECVSSEAVIRDGMRISGILKRNYGSAGRRFVEQIYGADSEKNIALLRDLYQNEYEYMTKSDTTEKQAMAAAVISVADFWLTKKYFKDNLPPLGEELQKFLASKAAVSAGVRAYQFLCDWVSQNSNKFSAETTGDVYGVIDSDVVYINRSVFNQTMADNGYDARSVLSYLRSERKIETRGRAFTVPKRISGIPTECVCLKMQNEEQDVLDDLPL